MATKEIEEYEYVTETEIICDGCGKKMSYRFAKCYMCERDFCFDCSKTISVNRQFVLCNECYDKHSIDTKVKQWKECQDKKYSAWKKARNYFDEMMKQ